MRPSYDDIVKFCEWYNKTKSGDKKFLTVEHRIRAWEEYKDIQLAKETKEFADRIFKDTAMNTAKNLGIKGG